MMNELKDNPEYRSQLDDKHPFVVQIIYKDNSDYHLFVNTEMLARNILSDLEEAINAGKHIYRYFLDYPVNTLYSLSVRLISIENVLDVRVMEKDPAITDSAWLMNRQR